MLQTFGRRQRKRWRGRGEESIPTGSNLKSCPLDTWGTWVSEGGAVWGAWLLWGKHILRVSEGWMNQEFIERWTNIWVDGIIEVLVLCFGILEFAWNCPSSRSSQSRSGPFELVQMVYFIIFQHPPTGLLWMVVGPNRSQLVTCWRVLVYIYIGVVSQTGCTAGGMQSQTGRVWEQEDIKWCCIPCCTNAEGVRLRRSEENA